MHREENEPLELPPKPVGPVGNAIIGGTVGATLGALLGRMLWKGKQFGSISATAFMAEVFGGMGLVNGYVDGNRNVTEHKLTVKNIELQHRVNELEAKMPGAADAALLAQVNEVTPGCGCRERS